MEKWVTKEEEREMTVLVFYTWGWNTGPHPALNYSNNFEHVTHEKSDTEISPHLICTWNTIFTFHSQSPPGFPLTVSSHHFLHVLFSFHPPSASPFQFFLIFLFISCICISKDKSEKGNRYGFTWCRLSSFEIFLFGGLPLHFLKYYVYLFVLTFYKPKLKYLIIYLQRICLISMDSWSFIILIKLTKILRYWFDIILNFEYQH